MARGLARKREKEVRRRGEALDDVSSNTSKWLSFIWGGGGGVVNKGRGGE